MKEGDFGTKICVTICDQDNQPLILTGATKITLVMSVNENVVERECFVEDETNGVISYVLQDGDIPDSGTLYMEVEVQYGDQSKFTSSTIKETIKTRVKEMT